MNRARTFPPSPAFAEMTTNLANQLADFEAAGDSDEAGKPFFDKWCATEKALTHTPALTVGDLLLKIEVLCKIAEDSKVEDTEWQALGRDAEQLNGPGMAFVPEAWLRRWTERGGGYVRTDSGIAFVAHEPQTRQQGFLMDELRRANGSAAIAAYLDGRQAGDTIRQTWGHLKAAYDAAVIANQRTGSDDDCNSELAAWDVVMLAPAPDMDAVRWKFAEQFRVIERDGDPGTDDWQARITDALIADMMRLASKGGAS